jgi:tripartite-type tricarboxylate transporter receptor subunit TctC
MTGSIARRQLIHAAAASSVAIALPALPQLAYLTRPVRLVCPWPAGGSTDSVMRARAESASRQLGQNVVIDNKPGAGGMLGANELTTARPHGYTLSQLPHGVFRIPHMQKVQFNTWSDFTWIVC